MRKVIVGEELKNKMKEAIDLLCNTVKVTLGPKGSNIIIDHSEFSPFITNDGVTIAENVESDDEAINTILELAKESTIRTNESVGDGTTTTLVLLQSIFNEGLKFIEKGVSPIILKKELDDLAKEVIYKIKLKSRKPKSKELLNIAQISANDKEIGKIVFEVYSKIKDKNSISIKEGSIDTLVNYLMGYTFDTIVASEYFFTEEKEINYKSPYILISDSSLEDIEELSDILNKIYKDNKSLVIIANDYGDMFINEMLSLVLNHNYNIILLKTPEYGIKQMNILKDIESISLGKIVSSDFNFNVLGVAKNIKINKDRSTIEFIFNDKVRDRIQVLKDELKKETDSYEKEFYNRRISMLKRGTAEIIVGAPTKTERREKIMRFEDALCSLESSKDGILVGGGMSLFEIGMSLEETNSASTILKSSLISPIKQIINNSGLKEDPIISEIVNSKFDKIFNAQTENFEFVKGTKILDSKEVVVNSFINAISIAGMLLTTTSLVINENKNISKNLNYNDL